jgi:hypothetical protein
LPRYGKVAVPLAECRSGEEALHKSLCGFPHVSASPQLPKPDRHSRSSIAHHSRSAVFLGDLLPLVELPAQQAGIVRAVIITCVADRIELVVQRNYVASKRAILPSVITVYPEMKMGISPDSIEGFVCFPESKAMLRCNCTCWQRCHDAERLSCNPIAYAPISYVVQKFVIYVTADEKYGDAGRQDTLTGLRLE